MSTTAAESLTTAPLASKPSCYLAPIISPPPPPTPHNVLGTMHDYYVDTLYTTCLHTFSPHTPNPTLTNAPQLSHAAMLLWP